MQGFNMGRYVPPDQEGVISGNQLNGKHALGARANKISQGILTVRFEMPYPIWCTHCPKPTIIGQGVRFNAEKKKVGNYFSSPIYSFRMKHIACGGVIEIRTDPKNTAYVVTEGARKRDLGEDKVEEGDIKIMTQEERETMRDNAFAALEGKVEDKKRVQHGKRRLEELEDLSEKQWEDPYERNKQLRKSFREGRHLREKEAGVAAALQDKMSLGLDLLPEHADDANRARFIEYGESNAEKALAKAISKPMFGKEESPPKKSKGSKLKGKLKAEHIAKQRKADIVAEIRGNTRAVMDPFLTGTKASEKSTEKFVLAGMKRKRPKIEGTPEQTAGAGLVDYDSD
ncbi:Coiled-coil domain-containing protein [Lachnellula occidentalis]|uniref:Coiled-coil domain-containing protein n=1 Tax=Lachnellula occidentalis TaxID=215460 RepID=A0A8H8S8Y6_9HELO|nr:Coiled-coil domain-containing protein [Lachnellula occidentalis]